MGIAVRAFWVALKDYYEEMFKLVGANLLWAASLLPLGALPLVGWSPLALLFLALLIAFPPATAAMFCLTNRIAHHRAADLGLFFAGFRKHFFRSWLLALLNVVVLAMLWANASFYGQMLQPPWAALVQGLCVGLTVMWCLIQLYVFPMLLEQEEPRLLLALRNAAFLAFASPITTLVLGALLAVSVVLSAALALPFAVALMAIVGLAANEAVLALLVRFGIRQPEEEFG
ncbi:MAG TPA: DUF624 domain-containing protein [Anaerolineae bacterium]|nr:DUF624 domain-containing protein [Anaerolineae bacterium]HOR01484.1 DUF624 domain-containing protein [Anaerolineae bacterium]HPL28706.1 DUF624 domain-containing protein [Anaerolineae bacterium]